MNKINPCPHCNHKADIKKSSFSGEHFWVQCANHRCRASYGGPSNKKETAIAKWNLYPKLLEANFTMEEIERQFPATTWI